MLNPSGLAVSGRPKRATKDVSDTWVFSMRGTLVNSSVNWQFPGSTMDLMGGEARLDGWPSAALAVDDELMLARVGMQQKV